MRGPRVPGSQGARVPDLGGSDLLRKASGQSLLPSGTSKMATENPGVSVVDQQKTWPFSIENNGFLYGNMSACTAFLPFFRVSHEVIQCGSILNPAACSWIYKCSFLGTEASNRAGLPRVICRHGNCWTMEKTDMEHQRRSSTLKGVQVSQFPSCEFPII